MELVKIAEKIHNARHNYHHKHGFNREPTFMILMDDHFFHEAQASISGECSSLAYEFYQNQTILNVNILRVVPGQAGLLGWMLVSPDGL